MPESCLASNLPAYAVDDRLMSTDRVLLRKLLAQDKASVVTAENINPYLDITVDLQGEHGANPVWWEIGSCDYQPIGLSRPEFSPEVV